MSVCGCLIDMFAKYGKLQAAKSIFSLVSYPDLKCLNAMLGACSFHGMAEDALKIFEEILEHELRPDEVTFLSLLSACCLVARLRGESSSGLISRKMVALQDPITILALDMVRCSRNEEKDEKLDVGK
ncbi:hypothetical protein V6N13_044784 [Hibiscus sabdariffa]